MRIGQERLSYSPGFTELFRFIREITIGKPIPQDDDDLLGWHLQNPLWNLQNLETSTGWNIVASGVHQEGGEPFEWSTDALKPAHRTTSIGHLDITDIDYPGAEMGNYHCFNELTIDGQVIQSGDAFYDPSWDGVRRDLVLERRLLDELEIRRLNEHMRG